MTGAPLNILHVQGSFDLGGKEARTVGLMNIWGDRARHTMLIGNPAMDGARSAINARVDVRFPVDAPSIAGRPSPRRLHAIARYMQGFDLVLSYNWGAMDAVMAHRLFHRMMPLPPLIHHEDGFNADEAAGLKRSRNIYRRLALHSAHGMVVPSATLEHIAISAWRQPSQKVHNIPNGIDVAAYGAPPRPDAIPGLVRTDDRVIIGTLAGLRPVKNLSRLVRIAALLRDKVTVVIVGEGPDRAVIEAVAERRQLTSLVLPGFMARPQDFVGLFDIFALTSDSEQFPISLVEAMAAGLPVLATDVGDVCSIVSSCNRPYILPPGDEDALAHALSELVHCAELRQRLGAANRHKALDAFDIGGMVARYAALYDSATRTSALTGG
jgi:glycosyltransferase involved in cell wall biosynthesis